MKKVLFISAIAVLSVLSCADNDESKLIDDEVSHTGVVFTASYDNSETKSTLHNDKKITWDANDSIRIFGNGSSGKYVTSAGGQSAEFAWSGVGTEFQSGEAQYAIYPYAAGQTIGNNDTVTFSVPDMQTYKTGSFGQNANVAIGQVDGTDISFKNAFGYLKFTFFLESGSATLGKVILKSNSSNEKLWGIFKVDATSDQPAAEYVSGGSNTLTLDCTGLTVGTGTDTVALYFVVPAGSFKSGFTVDVYTKDGHLLKTLGTSMDNTIARNDIKQMPKISLGKWLPSTYTEKSYIQSTGKECISTGYIDNDDKARFEADCEYTSFDSGDYNVYIAGTSWTDPTNYLDRIWLLIGAQKGNFKLQAGPTNNEWTGVSADNNRHLFTVDYLNETASVDNSSSKLSKCATTGQMLFLLCRYKDGAQYNSKAKLYSFKIYSDNKLAHYYVPCKNNDNVEGVYDLVTGKFHIMFQSLSYIQSDATKSQYINTGYNTKYNSARYEAYCQYTTDSGKDINKYIAGSQASSNWILIGHQNGKFKLQGGNGDDNTFKNTDFDKDKHTFVLDIKNKKCFIDGTKLKDFATSCCGADAKLYLFARNNNGKVECYCDAKLYCFRIYEDDTLVRLYIPALSGTTPGLFECVQEIFYANSGDGNFSYPK